MPEINHAALRLFVAVALPEVLKDTLEQWLAPYRHPAIRLVPRENLHLTLHFIGNVPAAILGPLHEKLLRLAPQFHPFRLRLQEVAPGPQARNPRLVWARFSPNDSFAALSQAVAEACGPGQKPHPQPIPHVTLARFRKDAPKPAGLPVQAVPEGPALEVTSFALWQSHLGQPHPRYEVIREYLLAGNDAEA